MKDFYVKDAAQFENKIVTTSFVVGAKQIKPKKTGDPYLALTLCDRTGQLDAKMWDNVAEVIDEFDQDDFVKVRGLINKYNGRFQLTIYKLRPMGDSEVDFSDYLPTCPRDIDGLWRTLSDFVASFQDRHLKALIQAFMDDPEIAQAYRTAPAAKTLHHAYIGGLLDHVVSLFKLCDLTCHNYPHVNRDLLMTGAFLHDIGKIHELSWARSFSYTTRGQLLGHMIIELEMLQAKIPQVPDFPAELKILIEHLIISHHGHYEFGSPKLPMFPEALMLHYLDDLDSKMESVRAQFEREGGMSDAWTSYNPSLGRPLLNSQKYIEKAKPNGEPGSQPPASAEPDDAASAPSSESEPEPSTESQHDGSSESQNAARTEAARAPE